MEIFTHEGIQYFIWRTDQARAFQEGTYFSAISLDTDGNAQIIKAFKAEIGGKVGFSAIDLGTFHVPVYESFLKDCARWRAWKVVSAVRHKEYGCYEMSDSGELHGMCEKYCAVRPNHNAHELYWNELTATEESNLRTVIEIISYTRARIRQGNN